jgi:hypothetical protein
MKLQYLNRGAFDRIVALCTPLTPLGLIGWAAIAVATAAAATSSFVSRSWTPIQLSIIVAMLVAIVGTSLAFHGVSPDNTGYAQVCDLLRVNVPICHKAVSGAVLSAILLTVFLLAAAIASTVVNRPRTPPYASLIAIIIVGMISVDLAFHGFPTKRGYAQICQLLIFGMIVMECRKVVVGPTFSLIALALVGLVIVGNFTVSSSVELLQHNRAWTSPLFEHANVIGIAFTPLTIFSFLIARSGATTFTKTLGYSFCAASIFFVAASGSRTALLAVGVFFSVFAVGIASVGSRRVLCAAGMTALAMVPILTFGYLAAVGVSISFSPSTAKGSPSTPVDTRECEHSSSNCQTPQARQTPRRVTDPRAGGILGLNKRLASGRDIIWPGVIEAAGRSPVWGHGLGRSPKNHVRWPKKLDRTLTAVFCTSITSSVL